MTTRELEELLEGGIETPHIEYKTGCLGEIDTFAKDILAIANIEDGGWIIIGMAENKGKGYKRVGVTEEQVKSFNYDIMRDKFASFASPHVQFSLSFPQDKNGLQFVVIRIDEFSEVPVICIKSSQSAETKAPTIYYRNTVRRVESGPISNYHDLRNLLERSAVKMRIHWENLSLSLPDNIEKDFDEELGKLL